MGEKVLSLLQPWATLVVTGAKRIETRSWTTRYRSRLLIHAGKSKGGAAAAAGDAFRRHIADFDALPFGAIIGEVTLCDVVRAEALPLSPEMLETLTLEERAFGDYRAGRWAWLLRDAVAWDEPVPAAGKLGIWEW